MSVCAKRSTLSILRLHSGFRDLRRCSTDSSEAGRTQLVPEPEVEEASEPGFVRWRLKHVAAVGYLWKGSSPIRNRTFGGHFARDNPRLGRAGKWGALF